MKATAGDLELVLERHIDRGGGVVSAGLPRYFGHHSLLVSRLGLTGQRKDYWKVYHVTILCRVMMAMYEAHLSFYLCDSNYACP